LKFVHFQKERVNRKEITGATVRNYVKSIKFCEMSDLTFSTDISKPIFRCIGS
jgi:hypothetical protein